MALNDRWQSLAVCHVKQAHASMLYADQKAMAEDDERYVTWNWCTRKEESLLKNSLRSTVNMPRICRLIRAASLAG